MATSNPTVSKTFSVVAGGTVDINLASVGLVAGNEFIIHNIYYDATLQISTYDGTTLVTFDNDNMANSRQGMCSRVNNSQWIRITNNSTGTLHVSFDGIQVA